MALKSVSVGSRDKEKRFTTGNIWVPLIKTGEKTDIIFEKYLESSGIFFPIGHQNKYSS